MNLSATTIRPTNRLFLKVSFARPHSPYDPPQRYLDMYKDALIPDPAIGDWCGKYAKKLNPEETAQDAPYGNFGNEYARNSRRHYYANITFIDEQIGRIIQTLKEKDMYNDALIVFVSDHGRYDGRPLSLEKDLSIRGLHSCAIHREMAFCQPRYTGEKQTLP